MCVYFILNTLNGKYYVGKTKFDIERRLIQHKSLSKNPGIGFSYLHKAIRKYGFGNFETRILFTSENEQLINEAEKYFIAYFQATDPKIGYNLKSGGNGGTLSEATKQKISLKRKGQKFTEEHKLSMSLCRLGKKRGPISESTRIKMRKSALGRKMSEEAKAKMSKSRKGKILTEKHKENIRIAILGKITCLSK